MTEQTRTPARNGKSATQRNKKFVVKKPVTPKQIVPKYIYVSKCHSAPGRKKALVRESLDSKTFGEGHLGVFRCSECGKHSTFNRVSNTGGLAFDVEPANAIQRRRA